MSKKIWDLIDKHKNVLLFLIITTMSIYIRISLFKFESGDYVWCLEPWFYQLKDNGGLSALKLNIGNYNMPYLTVMALLTYLPLNPIISIKLFSVIFDYVCAFAIFGIVQIVLKNNKHKEFISIVFYGIVLFLPTVILNSACWGQADSIYTAFALLAVLALLREKYLKAFVFLGISFAFKLQFIFILPLFVLVYISKRKFPIYYFLIIPLVNIIMCLPAIAFGKPFMECINIYISQTSQYNAYLSMNFPDIYNLIFPTSGTYVYAPTDYMSKVGTMSTLFIFAVMAFAVLYKKIKFNKQAIIEFGLWSVMIATFCLPHMHDRYLFMGDVLSIAYCLYNKDKIYVPIGISLISTYSYMNFLFGTGPIPIQYPSLLYLVLIVLVTRDLYKKYLRLDNATNNIDKNELI